MSLMPGEAKLVMVEGHFIVRSPCQDGKSFTPSNMETYVHATCQPGNPESTTAPLSLWFTVYRQYSAPDAKCQSVFLSINICAWVHFTGYGYSARNSKSWAGRKPIFC